MTTANVPPLIRGALHLADVATRLTMLDVACNRCPRTGRLRIDRLVADYGLEFELPTLRRVLLIETSSERAHEWGRALHKRRIPAVGLVPPGDDAHPVQPAGSLAMKS